MHAVSIPDSAFLSEEAFTRRLYLEQRRSERSRRPFIFMLLEAESLFKTGSTNGVREDILSVFSKSIRETDIRGWYENGSAIGVIFTEIGSADGRSVGNTLSVKIRDLLASRLTPQQVSQIRLSFCVFPEDWDKDSDFARQIFYRESARERRFSQTAKRSIDIVGSSVAIILGAPLFLVIAAAIKLTSRGPILFRQPRVGQYGRRFTFFKFRSMYVNNDHDIHRDYVKNLIAGAGDLQPANGPRQKVFKLTNDPRITRLGKFLRRSSLDEMPQFLNVLSGEMSLVGPRPPIPYEVESYDLWHRRRLLGVKPGITGLWQITGRSRTTFDEMVRLDLQYAKSWSVWLDLKILLQTPRAVVAGDGAY